MTQIPAGWYPDPDPDAPEPKGQRYWDGQNWTAHVQPAPGQAPPAAPTGYPEGPAGYSAQPQSGYPGQQQFGYPAQAPPYAPTSPYAGAVAAGGPTTPDGQVVSGWGRRAGAFLIDWVIRLVLTLLAAWPWVTEVASAYTRFFEETMDAARRGAAPPDQMALMSDLLGPMLVVSLIGLGVNFVYNVAFWKWRAATPGKMALGLRIRLRERPGPLSWGTVLLRWVGQYWYSLLSLIPVVGFVAGLYPLLNYLWPLWDDKNQALHDKVARTNVVRT